MVPFFVGRKTRPQPRKIISVWPESLAELRDLLIDREKGVLFPPTRVSCTADEPVLLDLRLPDPPVRMTLRARAAFTIPEGRGPLFVCDVQDRHAISFLARLVDGEELPARAHARYPVDLAARVVTQDPRQKKRVVRGRVRDVSATGARIVIEGELGQAGTIVELEVTDRVPAAFPRRLTARVLGRRGDGVAVHFDGPDFASWSRIRRALRKVEESGLWPALQ